MFWKKLLTLACLYLIGLLMAKVVSFSLDNESLELLEKVEALEQFGNRSEAIRAALQLLLNELHDVEKLKGHVSAVVVATHSEQLEGEVSKIKHNFSDIVSTHVHNNVHSTCLETFVIHGASERIAKFVKALRSSKAVSHVKLMVAVEKCL